MNMKTTLATTATALALAGCAGIHADADGHGGSMAAAAPTGMSYCQRDKLVVEGGRLTCNWAPTAHEACESPAVTTIAAASVASGPDRGTICANGTPLVRIATK